MSELVIHDYRPEWKVEFESIASEVRAIVAHGVLRIDHIGSTSVPELAAKDIIDIQLTVVDLDRETAVSNLRSAGYALKPGVTNDLLTGLNRDSLELRKRFLCEKPGQRQAHFHVREQNRLNQEYPLLFRDFLRADPVARKAYETVKRELAAQLGEDVATYYKIKDPHMDTVYQAAKLWARLEDWRPDQDFL